MDYGLISFHIVNTPIDAFEALALRLPETRDALRTLAQRAQLECVTLATCNRIEFYVAPNAQTLAAGSPSITRREPVRTVLHTLLKELETRTGLECLGKYAEIRVSLGVVEHLFATAAGLNSIAIGETQIQGQVKQAYLTAQADGCTGKALGPLFEAALHAGKRARTETGIEQARISLGNLAIGSLQQAGKLGRTIKVAILGTGKMAKNAAEYLIRNGISRDLVFLSQHPEQRADQLAYLQSPVEHIDHLPHYLATADLIFAAYGTREVFITRELLQPLLARRIRPLHLIDIALPRDIDPTVAELSNVHLIDFRQLQKMKGDHPVLRNGEIGAAEAIVDEEVMAYQKEMQVRQANSSISVFRQNAEALRRKEVARALRKLNSLPEREQEIIEKLTYNLVNKILNQPTVKIREKALSGELQAGDFRLIDEIFS